jgi:hypothetical protein
VVRKTGNAGRYRNERLLRQADVFDSRGTDRRRRLVTALDAINRRVGRDSDFYAGAGIHGDRKAFSTPVILILPELRHIRSGSLANTRPAQFGRTDTIRGQPIGIKLDVA